MLGLFSPSLQLRHQEANFVSQHDKVYYRKKIWLAIHIPRVYFLGFKNQPRGVFAHPV
jgi:hypothetical protein